MVMIQISTPHLRLPVSVLALGVFFGLFSSQIARAQQLEVSGIYQGEDLYVVNEVGDDGVGFCCYEVRVNGKVTSDEVNSHAFEIDLDALDLEIGRNIIVQLAHRQGCRPRILNMNAMRPEANFNLQSITVDDPGKLAWKVSNEAGALPYSVQQYKWGRWVEVDRVYGIGMEEMYIYSTQVRHVPGLNRYRVVQTDLDGGRVESRETSFIREAEAVTFAYERKSQELRFSELTHFEVIDAYGTTVVRGENNIIDLQLVPKGTYFLSYGNQNAEFKKR
jgi:hypothetical protein